MKPLLIAISGGSGSGKTTVANKIIELLKGSKNAVLIHLDDYYKDLSNMPKKDRGKVNFDHPDSLDWPLLREHMCSLSDGKAVKIPTYSFKDHTRMKAGKAAKPAKIMIFEGIFALCDEECNRHFGLRIFVDTDGDIRFIRRMQRDIKERGRTPESVISQWVNTVKPMHEQFIEPSKKYAHIILPEHERGVSIELIKEGIKGLVK